MKSGGKSGSESQETWGSGGRSEVRPPDMSHLSLPLPTQVHLRPVQVQVQVQVLLFSNTVQ